MERKFLASEVKQVIVMRTDLNMPIGKIAAQAAHASMAAILKQGSYSDDDNIVKLAVYFKHDSPMDLWLNGGNGFTKIVLGVNSEEEMLRIYNLAKEQDIITSLITDNGKTVFNGVATNTCIALGPEFSDKINTLTGHLKLLK